MKAIYETIKHQLNMNFQCKTLKEHFGITTVEQAQELSDDKLKTALGINVMFCQKLRNIKLNQSPVG